MMQTSAGIREDTVLYMPTDDEMDAEDASLTFLMQTYIDPGLGSLLEANYVILHLHQEVSSLLQMTQVLVNDISETQDLEEEAMMQTSAGIREDTVLYMPTDDEMDAEDASLTSLMQTYIDPGLGSLLEANDVILHPHQEVSSLLQMTQVLVNDIAETQDL